MTEEMVLQRLDQLQLDEKRAWANLNAILGAVEDCQYWLTLIRGTTAEQAVTGIEEKDNAGN